MKHLIFLLLFMTSLAVHAQFAAPTFAKNQLECNVNFLTEKTVNATPPWVWINYARLLRAHADSANNHQYYLLKFYSGFQLSGVGEFNDVQYDNSVLVRTTDSSAFKRLLGHDAREIRFQAGLEKQFRLLYNPNNASGLQFYASIFGIVGFLQQLEQYAETEQKLNASATNNLNSLIYDQAYPILGKRRADYLRLGIGTSLGFRYNMRFNSEENDHKTAYFGFNFNFPNATALFLLQEDRAFDQSYVFTTPFQSTAGSFDLRFSVLLGIEF